MKKWTIFAFMLLGCGAKSGEASKPDGSDMGTFDDFSRWTKGMQNFSGLPSYSVGSGGSGSGGSGSGGSGSGGSGSGGSGSGGSGSGGSSATGSASWDTGDTGFKGAY